MGGLKALQLAVTSITTSAITRRVEENLIVQAKGFND